MRAAVLLVALATPAHAEPPLTLDAFATRVTGLTLTWQHDGQPFGQEQYLPGHRARWVDAGGGCVDGTYAQEGELICFTYDQTPGPPACWSFHASNRGLSAHHRGDPALGDYRVTGESRVTLSCTPKVGV